MKIRKEIRKRSLITIRPSVKTGGMKLAFERNVSFSRLIEDLLSRELKAASQKEG